MAFNIDFGVLSRGADVGQSWQAGVQTGQARALQQRRESALAAYSAAPSQSALSGILAAGDVQGYSALSRVEADRAERGREADARTAGANVLRAQAGVLGGMSGGVLGIPANGRMPGDFMPSESGGEDITVTARPAQSAAPSIADVYERSPEEAVRLQRLVGDATEDQRKQIAARSAAMGSAAAFLSQYPQAARMDAAMTLAPMLEQSGISRQELEAADFSDQGLEGYKTLALGVDKALDNARQDRSTSATIANQNARLGLARNADARGARADRRAAAADSRSAVRFRERNLDRAAIASSGGGIRSDTSDLEY